MGTTRVTARSQDIVYPAHLADRDGWVLSTITTPIAPLEFDLRARPFADGFARALDDLLGTPVDVGVRRTSGLLYTLVDLDRSVGQTVSVDVGVEDLRDRWLRHARPATLRALDRIRELAGSPVAEQLASLEDVAAGVEEVTYLHHMLLLPARAALSDLAGFVAEEGLLDTPLDALSLVAGRGNASTEAARRLWRFRTTVGEPVPLATGRQLTEVLETVAQEGDGYGLTQPGWLDDPAVPLAIANAYGKAAPGCSPAERLQLADARQAALCERARRRLSCRPSAVAERFETGLARARSALAVTEDHAPLMHGRLASDLRRFCLRLGEHLAGLGRIDDPTRVFDHHIHELADVQRRERPNARGRRRPAAGRDRAAATGSTLAGYIRHIFGQPAAGRRPCGPDEALQGEPGAPGRIVGLARRLRRHTDLGAVEPGDVLVVLDNSSIWSFGLPVAAGIITPGGSCYGHVASLARDYLRPCVVGLDRADVESIQDGDTLLVDGDAGTVERRRTATAVG